MDRLCRRVESEGRRVEQGGAGRSRAASHLLPAGGTRRLRVSHARRTAQMPRTQRTEEFV